jgi:hypothetical protein
MQVSAVGFCRKTPDTACTRAVSFQATRMRPCVMDLETAAKLWQLGEKLTGVKFEFSPVELMAGPCQGPVASESYTQTRFKP